MFSRRSALAALICAGALTGASVFAAPASSTDYPQRSIQLSVGFGPGSGPDLLARLVGKNLQEALGVPVVVENRTGAGGVIAMQHLARQPADGYAIGLGAIGQTILGPLAQPQAKFDVLTDVEPIAQVAALTFVLAVPNSTQNLQDFAKALHQPQGAFMGTMGAGTLADFSINLVTDLMGGHAEPVHFKSAADATNAVINNDVQGMFMTPSMANALVQGQRMRAIASTGPERSAMMPDVPTLKEQGQDLELVSWFGLFAPANTPDAILDTLSKATMEVLQDPALRERLAQSGMDVTAKPRAVFDKFVSDEVVRWTKAAQRNAK